MVVHDMKKAVGKLTKVEKVALKKGDKTILYEKLGLLEEKDLKLYQTKFGINDEQMQTEEDLIENLKDKTIISRKRTRSRYHKAREASGKEHFVSMLHQMEEDKKLMSEMDEEELQQAQSQKAKLKAMFREDLNDDMFCPIIIKCNQAGQLETILTETQKIIGGHYQL
jgi:hypothetical protein